MYVNMYIYIHTYHAVFLFCGPLILLACASSQVHNGSYGCSSCKAGFYNPEAGQSCLAAWKSHLLTGEFLKMSYWTLSCQVWKFQVWWSWSSGVCSHRLPKTLGPETACPYWNLATSTKVVYGVTEGQWPTPPAWLVVRSFFCNASILCLEKPEQ